MLIWPLNFTHKLNWLGRTIRKFGSEKFLFSPSCFKNLQRSALNWIPGLNKKYSIPTLPCWQLIRNLSLDFLHGYTAILCNKYKLLKGQVCSKSRLSVIRTSRIKAFPVVCRVKPLLPNCKHSVSFGFSLIKFWVDP